MVPISICQSVVDLHYNNNDDNNNDDNNNDNNNNDDNNNDDNNNDDNNNDDNNNDDICLISLSSSGMQQLLNICQNYATNHQLLYNGAKLFSFCFKNNAIN